MKRINYGLLATKAGWRWLVEVSSHFGAVVMVLLAVGVSVGAGLALPHWWLGFIVAGGLYGILFAEGSFRVWRQEVTRAETAEARLAAEAAAPRPHLRFAEPEVAEASIIATLRGSGTTVREVSIPHLFARINIVNDPLPGSRGATAERVTARIAFRADDGSYPVEMMGRWAETVQRGETGRWGIDLEEAQLDIVANGLSHPLDIAMKEPSEASCWAYNHENSTAQGMRLPRHELAEAGYLVRVVLRGTNFDPIGADYVLTNNPGVPLELRGPYPPQDFGDRDPVASGVVERATG